MTTRGHHGLLFSQGEDPYWTNVVSLLHFDGTNGSTTFTDVTGRTWTPSGNAQISTANPKFGTGSYLGDGTGDRITAASSADFNIFSGNFTVEFWFNLVNNTPNQCIFEIGGSATNRMNVSVASGNILVFSDTGSPAVRITAAAPTAGSYHHCVLQKSGTTFTLGVNGVSAGTSTTTAYPVSSSPCRYGDSINFTNSVNGRIDEARITKGVARYTFPFTPPASPFPNS